MQAQFLDVWACDQVRSCVPIARQLIALQSMRGASKLRPVMRRGPVWRYADQVQFAYPRSKAHRPDKWFSRSGLLTICPYVPPSCSHSRRHSVDLDLCGRHRRISIIFTLAHQRPGRSGHAIGQRHCDQHLRLALQHTREPRTLGRTRAGSPPNHRDGPNN